MVRPVCFMVMPFGIKRVSDAAAGAPSEVDFDALWEKALEPALRQAGYEGVRADQDLGALIIVEMLERLAWADLVVADLSIPNANVYYEVGVRHAAREKGCVLIAADWAEPKFDLGQIRSLRYPLPEGSIQDSTAAGVRSFLETKLSALAAGESPVWKSIPTYGTTMAGDPPEAFRAFVRQLSEFQARTRAVRSSPREERKEKALTLCRGMDSDTAVVPAVALELLKLVRDTVEDWEETLRYIKGLPEGLQDLPVVREQRALAVANAGDPDLAIGLLEQLIVEQGDTPERSGLLGGRYKRLHRSERAGALEEAIVAYERGRLLDLNDYYCVCNLAQLYRARGDAGDEAKAVRAANLTLAACERADALNVADEWLHATLLGAAFDTRDLPSVRALIPRVRSEPSKWKLESTLDDLARRAEQVPGHERDDFLEAVAELRSIVARM